ncbi:hypothetical protein MOQ72_02640 [Saccharopolyspora sp. K220]|uniref:hypothetical protein n=1 Tax=Saccharopolyspora soli TaxID=2926618 RepID=UPI001F5661E9|nr:hypothetical protein [Saccharopolyspora soli]MCI2416308.1 hypothetical protein [Saccharopolyspora soli]
MNAETDLFGNPVAPLQPHKEPRPPVNDMEFVERVLSEATAAGFVLIGIREDVYRRVTGDVVEKVSVDVDACVHQLIETKWFEIGGSHQVRYDRYTGPARSVLVPRKTKQALYHWQSLHKPWSTESRTPARSCHASGCGVQVSSGDFCDRHATERLNRMQAERRRTAEVDRLANKINANLRAGDRNKRQNRRR